MNRCGFTLFLFQSFFVFLSLLSMWPICCDIPCRFLYCWRSPTHRRYRCARMSLGVMQLHRECFAIGVLRILALGRRESEYPRICWGSCGFASTCHLEENVCPKYIPKMHGTTTEDFAAAASTPISYISWNAAGATQWHLPPSVAASVSVNGCAS